MKKKLFIAILFFIVMACLAGGSARCFASDSGPLRLHVVANSNSGEDQRVKLAVRDDLLAFSGEAMADAADREDAEDYVLGHMDEIVQNAQAVLRENGMQYCASVSVGRFYFPAKQYGNTIYPAGYYQAVRITLGEGGGNNWWCVMFPPLCIKEVESGAQKQDADTVNEKKKGKKQFKSIFAEIFE